MDTPTASILRLAAVKARVGLSHGTIYKFINLGTFPPPVRLGPRAVGWLASEIDDWIAQRIEASREPAGLRSRQTNTSMPPAA